MPISLMKILTGALLLPQLSKHSQLQQPVLPAGCEDYRIITGDPTESNVLILGERHDTCAEARERCSTGLLRSRMPDGIDPTRTVLLFEDYGLDEAMSCRIEGTGLAALSNDCRGWNVPVSEQDKQRGTHWARAMLLKNLANHFSDTFSTRIDLSRSQWKIVASEHVQGIIDRNFDIIARLTKEQGQLAETRRQRKVFSIQHEKSVELDLDLANFRADHLASLYKLIQTDQSLNALLEYLSKAAQRHVVLEESHLDDIEARYQKPNEAMMKAIRAVSRKQLTVVFSGAAHVDATLVLQGEKQAAKRQQIIQELYAGLQEVGPFAVLSCMAE